MSQSSFAFIKLNEFELCYVTLTIWHQKFVDKQLNDFTILFANELLVGYLIFKQIRANFFAHNYRYLTLMIFYSTLHSYAYS